MKQKVIDTLVITESWVPTWIFLPAHLAKVVFTIHIITQYLLLNRFLTQVFYINYVLSCRKFSALIFIKTN